MRRTSKTGWFKNPPRTSDNEQLRHWLTDRGSLTARLQARGTFSVTLLKQELAVPTLDEAKELHLRRKQLAWVREVALFCDGQPVVFAHSVLPRGPRGPLTRWLDGLGSRSLGALLFAHPRFARGRLSTRRLASRHPLYRRSVEALQLTGKPPTGLWARRSSFSFGSQRLLVTEVFSSAISRFPSTGTK